MFTKSIPLFSLFGFRVSLDLSWFVLAVLITWSLAVGLFPQWAEGLETWVYWVMGAAGAVGLFVSIVLHELGHALVARRCGMEMKGITLFIFGGVAEMSAEPPSAKAEFLVAVGGPAVSVLLAALFYAAQAAGAIAGAPASVVEVVKYLALINLVLLVFNMVPAFPLDGGRVLRAIVWHVTGDLKRSTRVTSAIGGGFGLVLIVLGLLSFIGGNYVGGVWWFILGMFLRGAARMSYQQVVLRKELEGEPVSRFMRTEPVTVSSGTTVRDLVERFVYTHQHKMYPVVDGDELVGCVTLKRIKELDRERWDQTTAGDIADACSDENTVTPNTDAMQALTRLNKTARSRLMVVEDGRLVGILSLKDLMGFLSMKIDLEGE